VIDAAREQQKSEVVPGNAISDAWETFKRQMRQMPSMKGTPGEQLRDISHDGLKGEYDSETRRLIGALRVMSNGIHGVKPLQREFARSYPELAGSIVANLEFRRALRIVISGEPEIWDTFPRLTLDEQACVLRQLTELAWKEKRSPTEIVQSYAADLIATYSRSRQGPPAGERRQ
jgi:hypothetical protein